MPFARPGRSVLELKAGTPRWYLTSTAGLFLAVIAALLITPLRWPYTVAVLLVAAGVLWQVRREEQGRARFASLKVYQDLSLALVDREGIELTARHAGGSWVTPWLIVLPIDLPPRARIRIVIARELNDPDEFRRFTVLCRCGFGQPAFAVADAERHNERGTTTTGA